MTKLISETTKLLWHIIGVTKLYTNYKLSGFRIYIVYISIKYCTYGIKLDINGFI